MQQESGESEILFRLLILAAATACAVLASLYSLTHNIHVVFSFLYILPIILCVYFFPRRAVYFTLALSLVYIGQVYLLGSGHPDLIAVATAWFAIFMTIGIVAASYANRMLDEQIRIRDILENSQDGILCFDRKTGRILEVNPTFARWIRYEAAELADCDLARIWPDNSERERFCGQAAKGAKDTPETEALLRAKDGTVLRFVLSILMTSRDRVYCSAVDITGSKIVDEEIRRTLEDLEEQVRARTAHLERINEELRTEILERRRFERTILSSQGQETRNEEDRKP
jgi:PAS domain S-box-containing protein